MSGQFVDASIRQRRGQPRTLAGHEGQILPERERNDQDVGEQDRGIEPGKRVKRLERDLGGGIAVVDEIEKAALLLPQLRDTREDSARPGASSTSAEGCAALP